MVQYFSLLGLVIVVAVAAYQYFVTRQSKIKERKRQEWLAMFASRRTELNDLCQAFELLLQPETGYFAHQVMVSWKQQATPLFSFIQKISLDRLDLPQELLRQLNEFTTYYRDAERLRDSFNVQFIPDELVRYSDFFDQIEGRKLDEQQRLAVITDEDNNLVIAGAGSGKTTTIVGKVQYVLQRYDVRPEELLLISFTNQSAATLAQRINVDGVEVKTFHKFGKDVLVAVEGVQPSIFDEAQFNALIDRLFKSLLQEPNYLKLVTQYFADFLKPLKSAFEFKDQGAYVQYMKDQQFSSYKVVPVERNNKVTYQMEVVKSMEECKIANFLLFQGVQYEYESPYEHDTATATHRQYRPDFTIIHGDRKIYLEHFAVSRDGQVPDWFESDGTTTATEKYQADMQWKRELHQQHGTVLIETYSYEMSEDMLFDRLSIQLQEAGVKLQPKSAAEIWDIIVEAAENEVVNITSLFATFITLMKSNNYTWGDLDRKNEMISDLFLKRRNKLFIQILQPIYERYETHLRERKEIDFSDMINRAAGYIQNGNYQRSYRYVIIDEFQDISIGRYRLIQAIKQQNPACKLFCVGDDWQSIYRFAGSDITLFKQFEQYFGYSVKSKIETTYRFYEPLIQLSSDFILRNPNQTAKQLRAISDTRQTRFHMEYALMANQDVTYAIKRILDGLLQEDPSVHTKSILLLGRYTRDFNRIKNEEGQFRLDKTRQHLSYTTKNEMGEQRSLQANFLTVHKAKGLEADIVILINANAGRYGFPAQMTDDPVLGLLLSEADTFEHAEERRLFYVAMTRAREQFYIIADPIFKSSFIREFESGKVESPLPKCPRCKTADLVVKKKGLTKTGTPYKFWGCVNYEYGCGYTKTEFE